MPKCAPNELIRDIFIFFFSINARCNNERPKWLSVSDPLLQSKPPDKILILVSDLCDLTKGCSTK